MSGSRKPASGGWPAGLAWATLGLSALLALGAVWFVVTGGGDLLVVPLSAALGMVFGVTGAVLASRLPRNPVGWILCFFALLSGLSAVGDSYITHARGLPGREWVAWTIQWSVNTFSPALVALSFLLFPTGTLPSVRWRVLVWAVVVASCVHAVSSALAPGRLQDYAFANPIGLDGAGWLGPVASGSLLVLAVPLILLAAASLFARMLRAPGIERQQIKWFAYAAAMMAIFLLATNVVRVLAGEPAGLIESLAFLLFVTVLSGIPVSMGVAILRYRLYDIDLIINRTLVYGALTAALVGVYLTAVVSLQYLTRSLTGEDSQLAVVASTLIIAALFNPLRRGMQRFVDRRFYRNKYDAARVLGEFAATLRAETDLRRLEGELVASVRRAVQPEHASLWLRKP